MSSVGQRHGQISRPLDYPGPDWVGCDPGHVHPARVELKEEKHGEPLQQHCVDGEEVAGHGGRLASKELLPAGSRPHR